MLWGRQLDTRYLETTDEEREMQADLSDVCAGMLETRIECYRLMKLARLTISNRNCDPTWYDQARRHLFQARGLCRDAMANEYPAHIGLAPAYIEWLCCLSETSGQCDDRLALCDCIRDQS